MREAVFHKSGRYFCPTGWPLSFTAKKIIKTSGYVVKRGPFAL